MGFDFSGIENVGEFFPAHYLSAVLERDLKAIYDTWKTATEDEGKRPPQELLAGLANRYFTAFGKAEGERDPAERLRSAQDFHAYLLEALGYQRAPGFEPLDGEEICPVHLSLQRDGYPFLWVLEAPFPESEDEDPLAGPPLVEQVPDQTISGRLPKDLNDKSAIASWREILNERLFRIENPPRWVLFLAGREALLIERHKWPQGKYLHFELGELFGRKQAGAMRAMAGLLHRDVLAPEVGLCLHDTLDENSHKHAYAVSGDLKHGVRRAVELLANEAVWYRREVQKQGVFSDEAFASKLTAECITWLYRLLFLFYIEARGSEVGAVPMKSDAYRKGYSLESLRDLELVPLTSEHARNGFFLHDSVKTLFRILNDGFPERDPGSPQSEMQLLDGDAMWIDALNSPLFDDDRLKILRNVGLRNFVLQEVLQLLSLSAQKKKKLRGRISYAQLGINQLGAVYEGLLSYTGFFAAEDLYEVASEKDCKELSGKPAAEREALKTYFVPASRIGDYKESEIVKDENGKKVIHRKGTFIFRLAGRNREKSASYYTPEVLTKCLVKYALKEILFDEEGRRKKTADEILTLTICEPAMGSSAFLIEAVDQLADAYLKARQEELGETILPEDYQHNKRRVQARLATNNCYGVDLNPTAVELAKVSLWLATLHEEGKCPWFGLRLATGNSLVGARREVFKTADVTRKGTKDDPNWLGLVPEPVPLNHGALPEKGGPPLDEHWTPPPRPKGTIYHFLLPAEGMAAFDKDKVLKELAPEHVKRIKEWRKEFCKPLSKQDADRLEQISDAVDRLFAQVVRERVLATQETSDRVPVWGERPGANQADLLVRDQEEVATSLEHRSSAYRRLKLAMDAWCALWFWPIEQAMLLPDRATWLAQLELILKGQVTYEPAYEQGDLFAALTPALQVELATNESMAGDVAARRETSADRLKRLLALSDAFRQRRSDYFAECGLADIDAVLEGDAGLCVAQGIADQLHFHHWPLRFAEVFADRGGFDLILGNPPWVRLTWNEGNVITDYDALIAIRTLSAPEVASKRDDLLAGPEARTLFLDEFASLVGLQEFLTANANYPALEGVNPNLYKAFLASGIDLCADQGKLGLLFLESFYTDTKSRRLRRDIYPRLDFHFHFRNELPLFPDVMNTRQFSLNVMSGRKKPAVSFQTISNLFHPRTIDDCYSHDGLGATPGLKDGSENWELRGHQRRILTVDQDALGDFGSLFDQPDIPSLEATLPIIQSREIFRLARQFAGTYKTLGDLSSSEYCLVGGLDETTNQKEGLIRKETRNASSLGEIIFQGSQVSSSGLVCKTPNAGCKNYRDYSAVDLPGIPEDFAPRTNFVPSVSRSEFVSHLPLWTGRPIVDYFRHCHREMLSLTGERSIIGCIAPPGAHYVNTVFSVAFQSSLDLLRFNGLANSVPVDFFVKISGKGHANASLTEQLPMVPVPHTLLRRVLRLNSLTRDYAALWSELASVLAGKDSFVTSDQRLRKEWSLSATWERNCPVRTDLERRHSLLEIDVLASIALGLSKDELATIYNIYFDRLQRYESERLYDQNGRLVPQHMTASGKAAVSLTQLASTLNEQAGFDIRAAYHPSWSDTEELRRQKVRLGKKEANVLGVSERCTMADLLAETEVRWSDEDHPEGHPVRLVGLRYTDPGLEPRLERVYPTPWTRCDREADYRHAWAEFERRLGKNMSEDTPL